MILNFLSGNNNTIIDFYKKILYNIYIKKKEGVKMYFITTLRVLDKVIDDYRTVGYFSSYRDAYDRVINNTCDIFEDGFYNYAVITFIEEGLYANSVEQQWFKMTRNNEVIAIIEYHKRPEEIGEYKPYIIG